VHVTFHPQLDVMKVKQEAVKIVEKEAEAERKRKEAASPSEKPQDNAVNQVLIFPYTVEPLYTGPSIYWNSLYTRKRF